MFQLLLILDSNYDCSENYKKKYFTCENTGFKVLVTFKDSI